MGISPIDSTTRPGVSCTQLLHIDGDSHPGMNTALEFVLSFGQTGHLQLAALKDAGSCHLDILEAARALGHSLFTVVQIVDKASTKLLHFGKGVRLTSLVHYDQRLPLVDVQF